VPRTTDGHPDLQGNWTNVTLTPIQRRSGEGFILTPEEVTRIAQGQADNVFATTPSERPQPRAAAGGWDRPGLYRWTEDMLQLGLHRPG